MAICYSQSDQFNSRSNRTMIGRCRSLPRTRQGENMPISLKTQAERTAKTPITSPSRPCRRFVRLSGHSRACTRRKPEDRTLRRRAGALAENIGTGRDGRGKSRLQQMREHAETGKIERFWTPQAEKAGQSRGVVRAPRRSHLPAVRAVSGIYEGVPNTAKNSPEGVAE